jgi:hypothetical protein
MLARVPIRILFALLCAALSGGAASGQAMATASGPGLYFSIGGEVSAFQADYDPRILGGWGVYGDLHVLGRYNIEAEARFLRYNTDEDVTQTHYLIGPRVQVARAGPLRPYVKFLVGSGRMQYPFKYAEGSFLDLAPGAGLDVHLNDNIEVRVIDVEYQFWPKFQYPYSQGFGYPTVYETANLHPYGISAGISFRLTRPNIFRRDPYVPH